MKRFDKKSAFILGLGTVFKTIYNVSEMVAARASFADVGFASDVLQIATQVGLVFVFFSHYGLIKALGNNNGNSGDGGGGVGLLMPPPPEGL